MRCDRGKVTEKKLQGLRRQGVRSVIVWVIMSLKMTRKRLGRQVLKFSVMEEASGHISPVK